MSAPAVQPTVTWKEVTQARFWRMLEILPPRFQAGYGFLVGEPDTHRGCTINGDFRAAYAAFYETAGRFFEASGPLTVAEFQAVKVGDVLSCGVVS